MSIANGSRRWIELDGAANARAVVPGVLLRADNLQALSPRDVRVLIEDESLEVVLDLRTVREVELEGPGPLSAHRAVRIEHRSLYPESGGNTDLEVSTIWPAAGVADEALAGESAVIHTYMSYLRRRPDSIVGSIRTIARAERAVLVHCAAGKDRTGVVVAMALDAVGVQREAIVEDYLATRERIEAIMARLVRSPTYRPELEGYDPWDHAPVAGTIERVLSLIDERLGGSVAWLRAHGLSEDDLEALHLRLASAIR